MVNNCLPNQDAADDKKQNRGILVKLRRCAFLLLAHNSVVQETTPLKHRGTEVAEVWKSSTEVTAIPMRVLNFQFVSSAASFPLCFKVYHFAMSYRRGLGGSKEISTGSNSKRGSSFLLGFDDAALSNPREQLA
jgi:hypothetical protein